MNPKEQWQACKSTCCLVPQKKRYLIEISGPDRGPFLQGLFSQDVVKNFPVGSVTYGVFPNVKGRIIADAYIWHLDQTRFLLDIESFALQSLLKHLETYLILMKAEVKERKDCARFSLLGPRRENVFEKALGETPPSQNNCKSLAAKAGFAASIDRSGFQELQVWVPLQQESTFPTALRNQDVMSANEGIYDTIQIESGIPKLGREMDETTFPQEVGLSESLNFKKGCFVGAEVLQRIFYQGHVNRTLALFSTPVLLPRGASIVQANAEVGKITTCIDSFQWEKLTALALAKISALESGEPLNASLGEKKVPLQILQVFSNPKP